MSSVATSFVVTKENREFLSQFPNRSKFLNMMISKARKKMEKEKILQQYNDFAESEEMNDWVNIANNSVNLV